MNDRKSMPSQKAANVGRDAQRPGSRRRTGEEPPKGTAANNVVIRASAGTGKTYRLSSRFLGLLAAGEPVDEILATTFTRKAAGEILGRVLLRLAEAATEPEKLAKLSADLRDPALERSRCLQILAHLVRHLHRLRVSTLDSFFIDVARVYGLELGLPPGWEIIDEIEDAALRDEAIRTMLRGETTEDVVRLMHLLTKGEAARAVHEQIAELVGRLYDVFLDTEAAAWEALPYQQPLQNDELQSVVEALAEAQCPSDIRFHKAREAVVEAVGREDWQTLLTQGLVGNVAQGNATYCKKPMPPDMVKACKQLADHAKAKLLARIADQTKATRGLLERFHAAYRPLKFLHRAMRFEDVTRAVVGAVAGERLDEVAHRLDAHVAHLLLDEFQDTSPVQWRALRPLAVRCASGKAHRSFFCVGDVKQAIYGWRGGVAEIFDAMAAELPGLRSEPLDTSYRSSPVVIDLVNRVFGNLAGNAALRNYPEAAAQWAARFHPHSTARRDRPGYCRMVTAPRAAEGQKQEAATWEYAVGRIVELHQAAPGFSIAALVRRNAAVAWLIRRLRQLGIEASEEGGNPLTDSPAVQWVLSLLTLADHPGHSAARFHVAHSPLGPVVGLTKYDDDFLAARVSQKIRAELMEKGYGPALYAWACHLAPECDARELGRLMQLVEMGYTYEAQATTRVDDFLGVVEETRVETPRRAAVRVMTVHQSKGLEFDIVVLPELDFRILGQRPPVAVGRPSPSEPIDRVVRYVSKDIWPLLPEALRDMFVAQERRQVEESLCVLYVALTRAVHALEIIVAPSSEREQNMPATFAGVLRAALGATGRLEPEMVVHESGDPAWHAKAKPRFSLAPAGQPRAQAAPSVVRLAPSDARLTRGLDRRGPSQLEGGPQVQLAQRLRLDAGQALDRGSILHAWFELIEWLDDGEPDDDALRKAAAPLLGGNLDLSSLIRQFREALARPAVRQALLRATYHRPGPQGDLVRIYAGPDVKRPTWTVFRECPFAIREGDVILNGKIDRVVVLFDGERKVGADVIDFKTDAVSAENPEALAARAANYRPQLEAYRRAAAAFLRLDAQKISTRLVFTEPGRVVNLD